MSTTELPLDNNRLDRDDLPTNEDYVDLTTNQTVSGVKTFTNRIVLPEGSTTNPSMAFTSNTGLFYDTDAKDEGYVAMTNDGQLTQGWEFDRVYLTKQLQLSGTGETEPALSFLGDADTGLYIIGDGNVGFSANGTLRWDYNTTRINSTIPLRLPNGSATAPSLTFTNDAGNNTGVYLVGADQVGFTSGGTLRWDYSNSRISSTIPIRITNGTAAVPSITFSTSDTDTGLYSSGDGVVEISTNGARTARFDSGAQFLYATSSPVERFLFNSNTTSGDVFQAYQTRGSTAAYFFYTTAGTFGTVSDRKLKKNIQDVQISKASQLVKLMNPKKYEWKESEDSSEVVNGFIAQDLKEAVLQVGEFGRLISEDTQGTLRVAHDQMLVVLAGGLRDALERIEVLEAEIKLKRDK